MTAKAFLTKVEKAYPLTFQEKRLLEQMSGDLEQWDEDPARFWHPEAAGKITGKAAVKKIIADFTAAYNAVRGAEKIYGNPPPFTAAVPECVAERRAEKIAGRCPVYSPKTRCCGLLTLDAVMQCGFDCTYCSIQSFYHGNRVVFRADLKERLAEWERELDPNEWYHIGTGQSSDSLMWGNREGVLDAVVGFAARNPRVLLELKTKSSRVAELCRMNVPSNLFATWSLNTQTVIANEERLTADLTARLEAARRAADAGIRVGFHFHPIVYYRGWQDEYAAVVRRLTELFSPEETVTVSMGTLTFIRPVMRQIRERGLRTKILQMETEEIAGKFSYPYERKKELFRTVYGSFPSSWKESVFFYLCMEDVRLWNDVFGYEYESNEAFEAAMKKAYAEKLWGDIYGGSKG